MPTIPSDAHAVNDTGHTTDHDNLVDTVGTLIVIAGQLYQLTMATPVNDTNNQPNLNTLATMVGSSATAVLSSQVSSTTLVLAGYGVPASGTGLDGDSYLNLTNSQRYNKQSGTWVQSTTANPMAGWGLLAATSTSGYAEVNGTGTILTYTFPSDGAMHRAAVFGIIHVAGTTQVGGQISLTGTDPGGNAISTAIWNGAQTINDHGAQAGNMICCQAGTAVNLTQSTALTASTTTLWAELWGS